MSESTTGRRSSHLKLALRVVVAGGLVALLYSRLDLDAVAESLRQTRGSAWIFALATYLAAQLVSGYRWALINRALGFGCGFWRAQQLAFSGMFFNLCLPTSIGGDVYKALALGDRPGTRAAATLSVFSDRAIGLVALMMIGAGGLWHARFGTSPMLIAATLAILALVASPIARRAAGWAKVAPEKIREAIRSFGGRGLATQTLLLSLVVQFLNVLVVIQLARGMGIDLPARHFFVAVPGVILLSVLPLSISGVGLREGGLSLLLAQHGLSPEAGVGLGLAWFFVIVAASLTGGLVFALSGRRSELRLVDAKRPHTSNPLAPPNWPRIETGSSAMSLSIVVPIYNEEPNLHALHEQLTASLSRLGREYEIVLVDDGSTDGSVEILRQIAASDPRVRVIRFRRNFGQTAAMDAGLHAATGDIVVTLDADLQNDPADIPLLVAKLEEGYDLVHGWRKDRQDKLWTRKVPSRIANRLISRVTRFPVNDLGCTLKAMRREVAQDLHLYGEMHRFIPILAHWQGARCAEVVTTHHPRRAGVSKYGLSRTVRVVLDLLTVKYMTQYLASPMKLFGLAGLAAIGLAVVCGVATLLMKIGYGFDMTGNPLLLLSAFLALAGTQFIVLGMLGELGVRTYFESQNKRPYTIRETLNFEPAASLEASPHYSRAA